jgi:hypothetical protein
MTSPLVCLKCGLAVYEVGANGGYRHFPGGVGRTPAHMRHRPEPMPREEYDRMRDINTPAPECRAITARYRRLSNEE